MAHTRAAAALVENRGMLLYRCCFRNSHRQTTRRNRLAELLQRFPLRFSQRRRQRWRAQRAQSADGATSARSSHANDGADRKPATMWSTERPNAPRRTRARLDRYRRCRVRHTTSVCQLLVLLLLLDQESSLLLVVAAVESGKFWPRRAVGETFRVRWRFRQKGN